MFLTCRGLLQSRTLTWQSEQEIGLLQVPLQLCWMLLPILSPSRQEAGRQTPAILVVVLLFLRLMLRVRPTSIVWSMKVIGMQWCVRLQNSRNLMISLLQPRTRHLESHLRISL